MSTDNSYDLYIARCKLAAVAEMFAIDDDGNGDDYRIHPDEAQGVRAILSEICRDLEEIGKRCEDLPGKPVTV